MYISNDSGHHRASLAIEKALKMLDPSVEVTNINSFNYTNPILEKIIGKTYMSVIRRKPEFWGYLYDNPDVVKKTEKIRKMFHKFDSRKLRKLIGSYKPQAVICTQAFPCGLVADYKRDVDPSVRLYGVLTDYAPHSYWIFDSVDSYFVPAAETGEKLIKNGVPEKKIIASGIPIDPIFKETKDINEVRRKFKLTGKRPVVLIMGGSQGVGNLKDVYSSLAGSGVDADLVFIVGRNVSLYKWFRRQIRKIKGQDERVFVYPYINGTDEIMQASSILISKPGGITTAEALAKGLPMLIINPIPGQEQMNADFLLENNIAMMVKDPSKVADQVAGLLKAGSELDAMKEKARKFSNPDSASRIAKKVLADIARTEGDI